MTKSLNKSTLDRIAVLERFYKEPIFDVIKRLHVEESKSKDFISKLFRKDLEALGAKPTFSPSLVVRFLRENGIAYRDGHSWKEERIKAIEEFYGMSLKDYIEKKHIEERLNLNKIAIITTEETGIELNESFFRTHCKILGIERWVERSGEATSKRNKEKWKDPEYRKFMEEVNRKRWERPGEREKMVEFNKELWSKQEHRDNISAKTKKQWEETDLRDIVSVAISESMKTRVQDPEFKETMRANGIRTTSNPEIMEKMIKGTKRNWGNPEFREKISEANRKQWSNPAFRKKVSRQATETMNRLWKDPEFRANRIAALKQRKGGMQGATVPEKAMMSILETLKFEYAFEEGIFNGYRTAVPDFTVNGKIIEVLGSYHHGNPRKYQVEDFDRIQLKTLQNDVRKHELYKDCGLDVLYIWDDELTEEKLEETKAKVNGFLLGEEYDTWYR